MPTSAVTLPTIDPTSIFELFRGNYGSQLLTAAVCHFNVFDRLASGPLSWSQLCDDLQLAARPAHVLITALRAFDLLTINADGKLSLSELAHEHLVPGAPFDVGDYLAAAADSPGVQTMVQCLRSNRPLGSDDESGVGFIYRNGIRSAMDTTSSARHFTLLLSGRAKNVAPALAQRVSMHGVRKVLDVGGGTGIYTISLLQQNPELQGIVLDRPEVLKVAAEMATAYGVADRLELVGGDMFVDPLPQDCEVILLSNILHDWDEPECQLLVNRCAAALPAAGRLLIHDVFLNDELDGPLPIALYSAALFTVTQGRAYSAKEYRHWLTQADLSPGEIVPTLIHCGVLTARK